MLEVSLSKSSILASLVSLNIFFQPATQMDLFTTLVKLANENIPQDRIIDGNDLRSDLGITKPDFVQDRSLGRSVYYYRGNLLMAIRNGLYKMHLWTWTTPEAELAKVSFSRRGNSRIFL